MALTFDEYQQQTADTAIYPDEVALVYTALGLASEAGEVAGKVKKVIRDNGGVLTGDAAYAIAGELGDVLWYAARLAAALDLGVSLGDIAAANLFKLNDRQARGVLRGSGDQR